MARTAAARDAPLEWMLMNRENPRDGFDVFVIDPANRTVEQVELEPAAPVAAEVPKPAKRRLAPNAGTRRQGKPRATKKRRVPKTAKRVAKRTASKKKKPASLHKRIRPKKKLVARVPALVGAAAITAPSKATRKPRVKRVQPPSPSTPPAPTMGPTLPAPHPVVPEPAVAAAMTGLAGSVTPLDESMMVLELCPPPRQGTIDIRIVDVR
jgi:hypothetical protein